MMKGFRTLAAALSVLVASCGSGSSGSSDNRKADVPFQDDLIGLWHYKYQVYMEFTAPRTAEIWGVDALQNCYIYSSQILTSLGQDRYADETGEVAVLAVNDADNTLMWSFEEDEDLELQLERAIGLDSMDLTLCEPSASGRIKPPGLFGLSAR